DGVGPGTDVAAGEVGQWLHHTVLPSERRGAGRGVAHTDDDGAVGGDVVGLAAEATAGEVAEADHARRLRPAECFIACVLYRTRTHGDAPVVGGGPAVAAVGSAWEIAEALHAARLRPAERLRTVHTPALSDHDTAVGRDAEGKASGVGAVEEAEPSEPRFLGGGECGGEEESARQEEGSAKGRGSQEDRSTHRAVQWSTVIRPDSVCSPTRRRYTYTPAARGCPAGSAGDQRSVTSPASWWVSISVMTSRPRRS